MIQPGAGLKHLDSDQIFDTLFDTSLLNVQISSNEMQWPVTSTEIYRAYRNEHEL